MAWLDVHDWPERDALVVDCQADLLSDLPTRFVIPLLVEEADHVLARLNPAMAFCGRDFVFVPQLATTLRNTELGEKVGSLLDHEYQLQAAIDFLMRGY